MSDSDSESEAKPTKRRKVLRLIIALGLLGGAGAGAALYARDAGLIHFGSTGPIEPERPHLVPRDDVGEVNYATKDGRPVNPGQFKASYYSLHDVFTSNLKGSEGFVQLGLGVSTYYDERVLENVKLHEMAVRSAVLMVLADQDPAALATPQGKLALKATLSKAINDVLKAKEGFGGIDDVYFTNFVMQ